MTKPVVFESPPSLSRTDATSEPSQPPVQFAPDPQVTSDRHITSARLEPPLGAEKTDLNVGQVVNGIVTAMFSVHRDLTFMTTEPSPATFNTIQHFPESETDFQRFFPTETVTKRNSTTIVIGLRFKSTYTVPLFKRSHNFLRYLSEHKAFLYTHKLQTLRLAKLGFIVGKSPILTWREDYELSLRTVLAEQAASSRIIPEDSIEEDFPPITELVPPFETTTRTINHIDPTNGSKWSTFAMEVVCESTHSRRLLELLHETKLQPRVHGTFVPHHLAGTDTTLYRQQLVAQNKFLNQIRKIPVLGLPRSAMQAPLLDDSDGTTLRAHLEKTILRQDGNEQSLFVSIEPTNRSTDKGKWFFLCYEENYKHAQFYIDRHLSPIYRRIKDYETIQHELPEFPAPRRSDAQPPGYNTICNTLRAQNRDLATDNSLSQHQIPKQPTRANIYFDLDKLYSPTVRNPYQRSATNSEVKQSARTETDATDQQSTSSGQTQDTTKTDPRTNTSTLRSENSSKLDAILERLIRLENNHKELATKTSQDIHELATRTSKDLQDIAERLSKELHTLATRTATEIRELAQGQQHMQAAIIALTERMGSFFTPDHEPPDTDSISETWREVKTPTRRSDYRPQPTTQDMETEDETPYDASPEKRMTPPVAARASKVQKADENPFAILEDSHHRKQPGSSPPSSKPQHSKRAGGPANAKPGSSRGK